MPGRSTTTYVCIYIIIYIDQSALVFSLAHLYPFSLPIDQQSSVPNPPASLDTPWLRGIPSSWNMIMTKK